MNKEKYFIEDDQLTSAYNNYLPISIDDEIEKINIPNTENKLIKNYDSELPDQLNIFRKIDYSKLQNITNDSINNQIVNFIQIVKEILLEEESIFLQKGFLPSISLNITEDNSAILEWIFKDFRIVFLFEINENESSWSIVHNKKYLENAASGNIDKNDFKTLIMNIFSIVFSNL
jgi:hypothetical protein